MARTVLSSLPLLLLCLAVLSAANESNETQLEEQHLPIVNISFIKEVTLSVSPEDISLTPQDEQDISGFLSSSLRFLDPIMHFFDSLVGGWSTPPPASDHVVI